jgi:hypothetical protein
MASERVEGVCPASSVRAAAESAVYKKAKNIIS